MRKSKRHIILASMVELIEGEGLTALTFDRVAERTGLTRGGLMYHFPTRDALLSAMHEHMAGVWEAEMTSSLPEGADLSDPKVRAAAYTAGSLAATTRAELLLMLESLDHPELNRFWREVMDRWAPEEPAAGDAAALDRYIARLASDGLWLNDAILPEPISPDLKARIGQRLAELVGVAPKD